MSHLYLKQHRCTDFDQGTVQIGITERKGMARAVCLGEKPETTAVKISPQILIKVIGGKLAVLKGDREK
jgi:hypothetical protein